MTDADLEYYFSESKLNQVLPEYEFRSGQLRMAKAVERAINEKQILIAEAGTGTGKTLSYLVPIVKAVISGEKRAVISTDTKALQSQIIKKDLPLAEAIIGQKVNTELCFGSANYLCKLKLQKLRRSNLQWSSQSWFKDFLKWDSKTKTGLLSEYSDYTPPGFLNSVAREGDRCLGSKCPFYKESPYFVARDKWKAANILIVNHSLLSRHLLGGSKLLPEYDYVVIDEAHRFADAFSAQSEQVLSLNALQRILRDSHKIDIDYNQKIEDTKKEIRRICKQPSKQYRQKNALELLEIDSLIEIISKVSDLVDKSDGELQSDLFATETADEEQLVEKNRIKEHLSESKSILQSFCEGPSSNQVLSISTQKEDVLFRISPIQVADQLQDMFLNSTETIVFTSATISVENSFDFFAAEIGLSSTKENSRFRGIQELSPFDYQNQSMMYIPKGKNEPGSNDIGFEEECALEIRRLIEMSGGGVLVIFSALRTLKNIEEKIHSIQYPIFSSSKDGISRAVELFRKTPNSVLLGLESYRQGLDIQGDQLRLVIIVRLPFPVPDDPIIEAKFETEKSKGRNPFITLQVPSMILKMKQGFGRLIRSSNDKGVVAILDPRLHTKFYGKSLLASLPNAKRTDSFDDLSRWWKSVFNYINN